MPVIINPDIIKDIVVIPGCEQWLAGDGKFLLMGASIFIIAMLFRKRIKNENEVTV